MNASNWIHAAIAAVIVIATILITGLAWPGALAAIGYFAGREHAQATDRMTADIGKQTWRAIRVFTSWDWWDRDSVMDFVAPTVTVILLAVTWQLNK